MELADFVPGVHAMTCDVEDYFQVSAFEGLVTRDRWNTLECRIPRNMDRILALMSDANVKATFFTLGWVAENFPEVIRRIVAEGHELASHGMDHTRVWSQSSDEFFADASKSKALLEDTGGVEVTGYRAASWSFDQRTPWAHDRLVEAGYQYSSSVYPIAHDHYGVPDAPSHPFMAGSNKLLEVPPSTVRLFGRNLPAAGGGYFRLYPLSLSKYFIRRLDNQRQCPVVFYFHPWELDPDQPRMDTASSKSKFRHYLNLAKFESRLQSVLQSFSWDRMDRIYLSPSTAGDEQPHAV